jgi:hypothetical protein
VVVKKEKPFGVSRGMVVKKRKAIQNQNQNPNWSLEG